MPYSYPVLSHTMTIIDLALVFIAVLFANVITYYITHT